MSHSNFVSYTNISSLERLFEHIMNNMFETYKNVPYTHLCKQFPVEYVIKLFIRVKIYFSLKCINRNKMYYIKPCCLFYTRSKRNMIDLNLFYYLSVSEILLY